MIRIAIITALLLPSAASAQTKQFYGADGEYLGMSTPTGPNSRIFYDSQGNWSGTALKAGRNTFYYGGDGDFIGQSQSVGHGEQE